MCYWVTTKNENPMRRYWISGPSILQESLKDNQSEYISVLPDECEEGLKIWNPNYGTGTIININRYTDISEQIICTVEWDLLVMDKKNSFTISYHHLIKLEN